MQQRWSLQAAKKQFGRVVADAMAEGPQVITQHGVDVAMVLSISEHRDLVTTRPKLSQFFGESPLHGVELDVSRTADPE